MKEYIRMVRKDNIITIPAEICRKVGLKEGNVVMFWTDGEKIYMKKRGDGWQYEGKI